MHRHVVEECRVWLLESLELTACHSDSMCGRLTASCFKPTLAEMIEVVGRPFQMRVKLTLKCPSRREHARTFGGSVGVVPVVPVVRVVRVVRVVLVVRVGVSDS